VYKIGSKSIYWGGGGVSGAWKGYRRAEHDVESFIIRDYYSFIFFSFRLSFSRRYRSGL